MKKTYKIMTYNLGHGRYNKNYYKGLNVSKKIVLSNFKGQSELIKMMDADFVITQENGRYMHNLYFLNQYQYLNNNLNYFSKYYPHYNVLNLFNHGNATFSKIEGKHSKIIMPFKIPSPTNNILLSNRTIIKSEYKIGDKNLIIFNIHLIAYEKYKEIRDKQLNYVLNIALKEYNQGNFVIIGGDFNTDIAKINTIKSYLKQGFKIIFPKEGTLRSNKSIYNKNTPKLIIDGFIISDNITSKKIKSILNFDYSDHSPVVMEFIIQ